MDAAGGGRNAVRQHAFQRYSTRRAFDVADAVVQAVEGAGAGRSGAALRQHSAATGMASDRRGRALAPVIQQLGEWGLCYAQDPLQESDPDVTILTWNIRRRVDPNVFGTRRVTVLF